MLDAANGELNNTGMQYNNNNKIKGTNKVHSNHSFVTLTNFYFLFHYFQQQHTLSQ